MSSNRVLRGGALTIYELQAAKDKRGTNWVRLLAMAAAGDFKVEADALAPSVRELVEHVRLRISTAEAGCAELAREDDGRAYVNQTLVSL